MEKVDNIIADLLAKLEEILKKIMDFLFQAQPAD